MKRRTYRRLLVVLASITALGLIAVSSAAGAGKPLVKNIGSGAVHTLNEITYKGEINPNGASTTYQLEYHVPEGNWITANPPAAVGEGTTYTQVIQAIRGLYAGVEEYTVRVQATNSYGTTTGPNWVTGTAQWIREGTGTEIKWPSTYASSGTFKIEVPSWSETVTCNESSSGTIGSGESYKDEYNLTLSNCALTGWPSCKVTVPGPIHLEGDFSTTAMVLMSVEFDETNCGGAFSMQLVPQPFKVTMPPRNTLALKQPMSYTATTKFGTHAVILTDTSEWWLTGKGLGFKFGWL
jgi:hypothetical protein